MKDIQIAASAPGKVILFGEHAVVHSQPAIAACLDDLRIFCHIRCEQCCTISQAQSSGLVTIRMPDFPGSLDYQVPIDAILLPKDFDVIEAKAPCEEVIVKLKDLIVKGRMNQLPKINQDSTTEKGMVLQDNKIEALTPLIFLINGLLMREDWNFSNHNLTILIRSKGLPVGAGLGSSAAFSVAVSAALHQLNMYCRDSTSIYDFPKDRENISKDMLDSINKWAFAAEGVIHGNPSGLDNTVSCYGGAVYYQKDSLTGDITAFDKLKIPPLDMILTNTFVPRSTKALVAGVGRRKEAFQFMDDIISAIGKISDQFRSSLDSENQNYRDPHILSDLIRTNQLLLQGLGVSHVTLNEICAITEKMGVASKLTGAGGGGCSVSYIEPDCKYTRSEIVSSIESSLHGFQCLESSVGGRGVVFVDPTSEQFFHNETQ